MAYTPGMVLELGHHLDGPSNPARCGLEFFYPNGQVMARFGQLPDGTGRVGMEICDETGAVKVIVGEIADGQYGLAAHNPDTGELVDLATLAFGAKAASDGTSVTANSNTYTAKGGPVVPGVKIGNSRRALVTLTSEIVWDPSDADTNFRTGYYGFRIIDESDGSVVQDAYDNFAFFWGCRNGSGGDVIFNQGSSVFLLRPINIPAAGTYTFEAMYKTSTTHPMTFSVRHLIVQPF